MKRLIVVLALVSFPALAGKYGLTGNQLHEECQVAPYGFCSGYITGAFDEFGVLSMFLEDDMNHCVPKGVTRGQGVNVVKKYLAENPAERNKLAVIVIHQALAKAWPCKAEK